jgi:hypothetical protein
MRRETWGEYPMQCQFTSGISQSKRGSRSRPSRKLAFARPSTRMYSHKEVNTGSQQQDCSFHHIRLYNSRVMNRGTRNRTSHGISIHVVYGLWQSSSPVISIPNPTQLIRPRSRSRSMTERINNASTQPCHKKIESQACPRRL